MPKQNGKSAATPAMRFAVPKGVDMLLVGSSVNEHSGMTGEDQLRNIGKELLDIALSPNFGWGEDGQMRYIADPVDDSGFAQVGLSRLLYEQRWVPPTPDDDGTAFIIYDLGKPAVEVISLPPTPAKD